MMRASGCLPRVVVSCGRPDEASPLAEGEGELVTSDARCCWHPEVKQCGHRTVMQLPRRGGLPSDLLHTGSVLRTAPAPALPPWVGAVLRPAGPVGWPPGRSDARGVEQAVAGWRRRPAAPHCCLGAPLAARASGLASGPGVRGHRHLPRRCTSKQSQIARIFSIAT